MTAVYKVKQFDALMKSFCVCASCVQICMHVGICGDPRSMVGSLNARHLSSWNRLSLSLALTWFAGWLAVGICLPLPPHLGLQACTGPGSHTWVLGPEPGLCALVAGTLLTEPSSPILISTKCTSFNFAY